MQNLLTTPPQPKQAGRARQCERIAPVNTAQCVAPVLLTLRSCTCFIALQIWINQSRACASGKGRPLRRWIAWYRSPFSQYLGGSAGARQKHEE